MSDTTPGRPRRPVMLNPRDLESQPGQLDPAQVSEAAHQTAAVLVGRGRAARDPEITRRLVTLVDELGMPTVAQLWADRPAVSLPGALWRLYTLREWVQRAPVDAAKDYEEGRLHADAPHAVAGAAEPPTPEAIKAMTDSILTGVFEGDLGVALDRAAAFCQVISVGRAHRADERDALDARGAAAQTISASALLTTARDLTRSAALWRSGRLE
ncbi:hypothetical protein [Leekyejoonella antrihumi]|uniref:DNA-directed RNA polymerase subunit beta n=1 Tax=Leekyejoonella antrihumi TaxID=1660198 RepID=A0A563E900_9MICO|nr:hypothetical protein [Leekyejoonella antrihumi]TWP38925.1 hypothetical protein FGL98_00535 [Leekyejoonella antrihumi]